MRAIDHDQVRDLFSLFADMEGDALEEWDGLCAAASAVIEGRMKADIDVAANMELLCCAAAGIAYSDYLTVTGGDAGSVRVGDISMEQGRRSGEIAEIRNHFLGRAAHLLVSDYPALVAAGADR